MMEHSGMRSLKVKFRVLLKSLLSRTSLHSSNAFACFYMCVRTMVWYARIRDSLLYAIALSHNADYLQKKTHVLWVCCDRCLKIDASKP